MITWAALLVLQGIEGGVGEPDGNYPPPSSSPHTFSPLRSQIQSPKLGPNHSTPDFVLIQAHLNMLQYTHQPSPSLRHRLASRLESSLQNMHTPRPAPEPETMADVSNGNNLGDNDGWAIFDHRSMELASQNLNMNLSMGLDGSGMGVGGMDVSVNTGMQGGYDGGTNGVGVGEQVAVGYGVEQQWMGGGNGEYSDAWQNTLFRLFGNVEEMPAGNGNGNGLV